MSVTWSDPPARRAPISEVCERPRWMSACQRIVILTFPSADAARAWDADGQPVTVP